MWTSRKHSRRKINPQLERLDERAVPATFGSTGFGGMIFSGPAIRSSGSLGFNTPVGLAQTQARLAAGNRFDARLALQHSSFGAAPFANRPFFSNFNAGPQMTSPFGNAGAAGMFGPMSGQSSLFGARSARFLQSNIARFSPLNANGFGNFSGMNTALASETPTHSFPFGSNGFYTIVQTPSGPAGLF